MGGLHDSSLEVTVEDMWLEEIPVLIQRFHHFIVADECIKGGSLLWLNKLKEQEKNSE
jgi:hypothetical protein